MQTTRRSCQTQIATASAERSSSAAAHPLPARRVERTTSTAPKPDLRRRRRLGLPVCGKGDARHAPVSAARGRGVRLLRARRWPAAARRSGGDSGRDRHTPLHVRRCRVRLRLRVSTGQIAIWRHATWNRRQRLSRGYAQALRLALVRERPPRRWGLDVFVPARASQHPVIGAHARCPLARHCANGWPRT
jgi:hypothetical protein